MTSHAPAATRVEAPAPSGPRTHRAARLVSLDAVRGLAIVVMLLAMSPAPASQRPHQLRHPLWEGLTFVDLFFPLFLFAVGVSMTLSSRGSDVRHVLRRAAILFLLGVALGALKHHRLALTGVLQHIAGSYVVAFAVLRAPRRWQLPLAGGIVVAVWAGYVLWAVGDDPWGRSGTLAHAVDGALFGGFTTEGTLQTLISSVTVLAGAFTGRLVREIPDRRRLVTAIGVRAAGLCLLGLLLVPLVPLNKRLWSPSFLVLSIGTSAAFLAAFIWLADVRRVRRPVAPLVHVGANPIVIYVLFMVVLALYRTHGRDAVPEIAPLGSATAGYLVWAGVWFGLWWLLAYALYKRRIFIKV